MMGYSMRIFSFAILLVAVHSAANARPLNPIDKSKIPTMDIVNQHRNEGTVPGDIPTDSVDFHVWSLELEAQSSDQRGQMFIGLEHFFEGSPTDVYELPVDEAVEIVSVNFQQEPVQVEVIRGQVETVNATKSIEILYKKMDWQFPESPSDQSVIVSSRESISRSRRSMNGYLCRLRANLLFFVVLILLARKIGHPENFL